jgi:hypothetical protein
MGVELRVNVSAYVKCVYLASDRRVAPGRKLRPRCLAWCHRLAEESAPHDTYMHAVDISKVHGEDNQPTT